MDQQQNNNQKKEQKLEHPIEETLAKALQNDSAEKPEHHEVTVADKKPVDPDYVPVLNKKQYLEIINEVTDPETGVGVADMGLIYDVIENPDGTVDLVMTLTSMGCPAGGQITTEIDSMLRLQSHVRDVKIQLVWDPPWTPEMMNPDVKAMLLGNGGFTDGGYNVFGL